MKKIFPVLFKISLLSIFLLTTLKSQDYPAKGYIQNMAIDYSEPNIVYSATLGQGLLKSTDYGESWNLICDKADQNNFQAIELDPKNSSRLLAGGLKSGVLLSTDKGISWVQIGLNNTSINDIAIDETNPKRVFVVADEGVYYNNNIDNYNDWVFSFDHDKFIKNFKDFNIDFPYGEYNHFQKIAISPLNPNTIIVAARWEGGYHRSDDSGKTWRHETVSGIFRRVDVIYFHPLDSNIICVGTHHQGLFKSYNNGKSWVPHSDGLKPQIRKPYYGAYLISGFTADKNNPDIFYSGSDYSSWKSTDGGLKWLELDKSLTCEFVRTMAVDPKNSNIVYAGSNIGMFKSTDAGKRWRSINVGLKRVDISKKITIQTNEGETEYVLSKEYPFVYRKTPSERWKSFSWILAESGAKEGKDLLFDEAKKQLILVTDNGNYISDDYGYRWKGKGSEIPFIKIRSDVRTLKLPGKPDFKNNYVLETKLMGDVFFNQMLVDTFYRNPPYISLQIVEEGYPFNNTAPAWRINLDDYLETTIEISKSVIDHSKKYLLYAEVRDFQKNYKTAYTKIKFIDNNIIHVSLQLKEGFCFKKQIK